MRLQLKIIKLLTNNLEKRFTINQIAKKLNESYSFVNRTITKMLTENLIIKEKVGNSLLCKLNLKNDKTKMKPLNRLRSDKINSLQPQYGKVLITINVYIVS